MNISSYVRALHKPYHVFYQHENINDYANQTIYILQFKNISLDDLLTHFLKIFLYVPLPIKILIR